MDARIVHFGFDDCHRIAVLKSAGYSVEECKSIAQLHAALVGVREVEAVVITETDEIEPDEAISVTRATSMAPLILFQSLKPHYDVSEFDLVVPCPTDPYKRLGDIRAVIDQRKSTCA
jgi:hypothetical protein